MLYNGESGKGAGIVGKSTDWIGVYGESSNFEGVTGVAHNVNHVAVVGKHDGGGIAVYGESGKGTGIVGKSTDSTGGGYGVAGFSETGIGVYARNSRSASPALSVGVKGEGEGYGVMGIGSSGVYARGNRVGVEIDGHSGDLIVGYRPQVGSTAFENVFRVDNNGRGFFNGGTQQGGADVAEFITSRDALHLGDVIEIDPNYPGQFRIATIPNSTSVAGVISSDPGVTLGAKNAAASMTNTGSKLALIGRVPVKVSAENGPIGPGDLLVALSTPGHAMRAPTNPVSGTVIGKALGRLDKGIGIIEMLVMLR